MRKFLKKHIKDFFINNGFFLSHYKIIRFHPNFKELKKFLTVEESVAFLFPPPPFPKSYECHHIGDLLLRVYSPFLPEE